MTSKFLSIVAMLASTVAMAAETVSVKSPDGRLTLSVDDAGGRLTYSVAYDGKVMLEPSRLGLKANVGDFSENLTIRRHSESAVKQQYTMRGTKASAVSYSATALDVDVKNGGGRSMRVAFRVSDSDVAFRYEFPQEGETACMVVGAEATSFSLPAQTTTFLCPQSKAMVGWKRTKPSYEEEYVPDAPLTAKSKYGEGFTFPCLFRVGDSGWVLISETGSCGNYPGCHLSDYDAASGYTVAFPMAGEANGIGTTTAGMTLPGHTPWRTVTVGATLKPIVETTVAYDVVEQRYEPSEAYRPGRYTWSWLIWQDNSVNYADQVKFVDLAAAMGYEYTLVDGLWDKSMGHEGIEKLSRYARSKGVELLLWYNSNGFQNDAPQGPKNRMCNIVERRKEMAWMKRNGIKGIKVDFFGGDKQHTMQLYEDILSDANDYGLQVIFHGCTLPRGWERMYPNFVASEAVLASENVFFSEHHARREPFELTMHPFCRNTVASMDWGGTIMNRYMSKDNRSRHRRYTTDAFEVAASVVCQSSVQCIAMQPNNLAELSADVLGFLHNVPTTWDETRFVDGYPGKYAVLARRSGDRWYVAGLNATGKELKLKMDLPMLGGKPVNCLTDKPAGKALFAEPEKVVAKPGRGGTYTVVMQPGGGFVMF